MVFSPKSSKLDPDIANSYRPMSRCVSDVAKWCASRRLQLNADKTVTIQFGWCSNLARLHRIKQSLDVRPSNIHPNSVVCDLGVYLD